MIAELGHFALLLALGIALVQTVVPLIGAHRGWRDWMQVAEPAASAQFLFVGFAFAALTYAFVVSDFSLQVVFMNSHSAKPMIYKISGVWGNHEGSLLLWVLILALFGACAAWFGQGLPATLKARVLAVQGSISVAFLTFMIFTSNPFLRLEVPPFDGTDLNPLLQDPGLAFHPPFLYLGYVGLSMTFSFAVAALIEGRVDAAWGRWVRPWTLAAWLFLTVGIALGSWWAYYELGWGGFWFWDPVENASFMPWLLAAALLHSAIVVEKREALKSWTILLAIMAFGFSLLGTFIVRSGLLTSVHAFANDPDRGIYILAITVFFTGGALTLYAFRAEEMEAKGVFGTVSRESALVLNNILLAVSAMVVFIGTIWPLLAEMAFGRVVSVGAPFFDAAFTPFFIALAVILPLGSMMAWKRGAVGRTAKPLLGILLLTLAIGAFALAAQSGDYPLLPLGLALAGVLIGAMTMVVPRLQAVWGLAALGIAIGLLAFAVMTGRSVLGPIGVMLGAWVVFGAALDLWSRTGRGALSGRLGRLMRLPRADWGKGVAHAGLGITIIGVGAITAWQLEDIRVANVGDRWSVGMHDIEMRGVENAQGPNYVTTMAELAVFRNGREIAVLYPEKRFYPIAGMPTTEAAIHNGILRDVYLAMGDAQAGGGYAVRTYIKPFANWIWGGSILMAIGGLISLTDRRLRVAAGSAKRPTAAVPAE